jgi:hypothetical protein
MTARTERHLPQRAFGAAGEDRKSIAKEAQR